MAGNNFEITNFSDDLSELRSIISDADIEEAKEKTLKKSAYAMAEMVRQAVVAEDKITSPAMNGEFDRGPGTSLATLRAWKVTKTGNNYTVKPNHRVEQRAVVLNYGYPGKITSNGDYPMTFNIDSVPHPVSKHEVEGPDYTGYWQKAVERFQKTDKLEKFAEEEIRKQFRKEKGIL